MKRILHITRWLIGITVVFVLLVAAVSTSNDAVLKQLVVTIDYDGENYFIEKDEVEETVLDLGYSTDFTPMTEIDPSNIEHLLENNAFIAAAEVYKELNGRLHVDVTARKPIIRVYNDLGISVYIDQSGVIMPLSKKYTARVPVANGHIKMMLNQFVGKKVQDLEKSQEHPDAHLLSDIYHIAQTTAKDGFWRAQCNQVYVTSKGEIELIPRVGDHRILIGDANELDKKLNKLKLFYKEGLSKTGWNEYQIINLKYANQVVCTKS